MWTTQHCADECGSVGRRTEKNHVNSGDWTHTSWNRSGHAWRTPGNRRDSHLIRAGFPRWLIWVYEVTAKVFNELIKFPRVASVIWTAVVCLCFLLLVSWMAAIFRMSTVQPTMGCIPKCVQWRYTAWCLEWEVCYNNTCPSSKKEYGAFLWLYFRITWHRKLVAFSKPNICNTWPEAQNSILNSYIKPYFKSVKLPKDLRTSGTVNSFLSIKARGRKETHHTNAVKFHTCSKAISFSCKYSLTRSAK